MESFPLSWATSSSSAHGVLDLPQAAAVIKELVLLARAARVQVAPTRFRNIVFKVLTSSSMIFSLLREVSLCKPITERSWRSTVVEKGRVFMARNMYESAVQHSQGEVETRKGI